MEDTREKHNAENKCKYFTFFLFLFLKYIVKYGHFQVSLSMRPHDFYVVVVKKADMTPRDLQQHYQKA